MSATTGYYWLVQYCADLARLETVNVGVVLFVPDRRFLRAAVTGSNKKVTRCFRGEHVDAVQLNALKESVVNGLALSAKTLKDVGDVSTSFYGCGQTRSLSRRHERCASRMPRRR